MFRYVPLNSPTFQPALALHNRNLLSYNVKPVKTGGRERIRTSGRIAPTPDFESGAFNHSATLPAGVNMPVAEKAASGFRLRSTAFSSPRQSGRRLLINAARLRVRRSRRDFIDGLGQN